MSMISEQAKELRTIANNLSIGHNMSISLAIERFREAADTIETLSAKLEKENTERSDRYYNGVWITCKERLPENAEDESVQYLITVKVGEDEYEIDFGWWSKISQYDNRQKKWIDFFGWTVGNDWDEGQGMEVIAWQPLPEPHKPQ